MKKRVLLIGMVAFLLMVFYFAGDSSVSEPESIVEQVATDIVDSPEDVSVEASLKEGEDSGVEEKELRSGPESKTKENTKLASAESTEVIEQTEKTEPPEEVPSGKEPDAEKKTICTLSVRCDEVLSNMDKLRGGKESIIPRDGRFFPETKIEFSEGESVFDVLYRELRSRNIHFEFVKTPAYNSVYIEGIGNLYEFDCGDYSGWTYRVNGVKPNVGCSQYLVKPGDVIHFYYTCNFLKDQ